MEKSELKKLSLLVAEDDKSTLDALKELLEPKVGCLFTTDNGMDAFDIYREKMPDVVLTDIRMPKMDGLEFIEYLRNEDRHTVIIFMSAFSDEGKLESAQKLGAAMFIKKPIDPDELIFALISIAKRLHKDVYELDGGYTFYDGRLYFGGDEVVLSSKELVVFRYLLRHDGSLVCTDDMLLACELSHGALRNHISNINKKTQNRIIKNISGQGYTIHKKI